jgi:hypothetical protein
MSPPLPLRRRPRARSFLALAAAIALALLALSFPGGVVAETIQPPGHRTKFEAPPAFKPDEGFAGAKGPSGASITIVEFPAVAFSEIKAHMTAETLASNPRSQMQDVKALSLARSDDYLAFEGRANVGGAPLWRALLVIHDDQTTAVIAANTPQAEIDSGAIKPEDVKASLSGAAFGEMRPAAPSFVFDTLGSFKQAGVVMNIATVYNRDGKLPAVKPNPPVASFAIIKAPNARVGPDPRAQGEAILKNDHGKPLSDVVVTQTQPTRIAGLEGFAYEGERGAGALAERLYGVYLIDGERFIWIGGSAPVGEAATIAELKQIFSSFRLLAKN